MVEEVVYYGLTTITNLTAPRRSRKVILNIAGAADFAASLDAAAADSRPQPSAHSYVPHPKPPRPTATIPSSYTLSQRALFALVNPPPPPLGTGSPKPPLLALHPP